MPVGQPCTVVALPVDFFGEHHMRKTLRREGVELLASASSSAGMYSRLAAAGVRGSRRFERPLHFGQLHRLRHYVRRGVRTQSRMKACTHHSCSRARELGRQCKVMRHRRLGHDG